MRFISFLLNLSLLISTLLISPVTPILGMNSTYTGESQTPESEHLPYKEAPCTISNLGARVETRIVQWAWVSDSTQEPKEQRDSKEDLISEVDVSVGGTFSIDVSSKQNMYNGEAEINLSVSINVHPLNRATGMLVVDFDISSVGKAKATLDVAEGYTEDLLLSSAIEELSMEIKSYGGRGRIKNVEGSFNETWFTGHDGNTETINREWPIIPNDTAVGGPPPVNRFSVGLRSYYFLGGLGHYAMPTPTTNSYTGEVKDSFSIEIPCLDPPDLAVNALTFDSEIICKEGEGKLVLPTKTTVSYQAETGSVQAFVSVNVSADQIDSYEAVSKSITLASNSTQEISLDVDLSRYVTQSKDSLGSLKLTAKITIIEQVQESDETNNTVEQTFTPILQNPQQYVKNVLHKNTTEADNTYWVDPDGQTMWAKFVPKCGSNSDSPIIPLHVLGKALNSAIDHFNWVQTFNVPSNWTIYTTDLTATDGIFANTRCIRQGHSENLLSDGSGVPVAKRSLSGLSYDPALTNSFGPQTYLFEIDGPEVNDLCWQPWENPGPDSQISLLADEQNLNATATIDKLTDFKTYLKFLDTPQQYKWALTYGKGLSKPNQFIHFTTTLVGVTENEIPVPGANYDSWSWKSNTTTDGTGSVIIKPSVQLGKVEQISTVTLEGGIFDVRPVLDTSLVLSQYLFAFEKQADGTSPNQVIQISSALSDSGITWTAHESIPWLSLSAASGTTPATVDVRVNTSILSTGVYTGTIEIASDSQSEFLPVTLVVNADADTTGNIYLPIVTK